MDGKKLRGVVDQSRLSRLASRFEESPFLRIWIKLNQSVAVLALFIAIVALNNAFRGFETAQEKVAEDRLARAWDVVTKMSGKRSNGGQVEALQRLIGASVPLSRIDLSNTSLVRATLKNAQFDKANLSGVDAEFADLRGADFTGANLTNANLRGANLLGVDFQDAVLDGADLSFATIEVTVLLSASMHYADLTGAKLVYSPEDEGGEKWATFIAALFNASEDGSGVHLLETACMDEHYKIEIPSMLELTFPKKQCQRSELYREWASRHGYSLVRNPFATQ